MMTTTTTGNPNSVNPTATTTITVLYHFSEQTHAHSYCHTCGAIARTLVSCSVLIHVAVVVVDDDVV
jgi:hypothetical protein